ncbi:PTS mannose/fructose/sorbose/N-acetylgalactosamine transporter subunit IIC [Collinsella vaginalis]|uniref:PTS mannose/fructose/sorbose/N-acetylgalactosamine transporter subunit IIC n=1 Tax=Collinsella vaginalis TaxID=1870987 RepID=UPI000A2722AD|nr:PTS sugar transporter subunit IIC [Collinsella vaginalis]
MEAWQILLLTLYAAVSCWDHLCPMWYTWQPAIAGLFAGVVMGDMTTGLYIGGTLQLMVLGLGTFGGSSLPDYTSGALIGTAFAVTSGSKEIGLAIAVPTGVLLVQLDVLARFANTYFQHLCEKACERHDWRMVQAGVVMGIIPWSLSRIIPMLACLLLGQEVIATAAAVAPEWLINGFKFVGSLLPSVGLAILLRYLPLSRYWMFALLGFFLAAYLKVPVLGVAIVGLIAAGLKYAELIKAPAQPVLAAAAPVAVSADSTIEGTIDDDE